MKLDIKDNINVIILYLKAFQNLEKVLIKLNVILLIDDAHTIT